MKQELDNIKKELYDLYTFISCNEGLNNLDKFTIKSAIIHIREQL